MQRTDLVRLAAACAAVAGVTLIYRQWLLSLARKDLTALEARTPRSAAADVTAATIALDEFAKINAEILSLSRRNSNVRSLALSLGRKRTVAAICDDHLRQLNDALASHGLAALGRESRARKALAGCVLAA
jgi:uncharacterized protein YPO0396